MSGERKTVLHRHTIESRANGDIKVVKGAAELLQRRTHDRRVFRLQER
jgi:hypothetical protein